MIRSISILLILLGVGTLIVSAQSIHSKRIKGMRIDGQMMANFPLVYVDGNCITISFDTDDSDMTNFRVKVYHCDKNWNVTQSSVINDEFRNFNRNTIPAQSVPAGVKKFRWTYSFKIPGADLRRGNQDFRQADFIPLPRSGNYKFEIWDEQQTDVLAEGKFFAVEKISNAILKIDNQYLPSGNI